MIDGSISVCHEGSPEEDNVGDSAGPASVSLCLHHCLLKIY